MRPRAHVARGPVAPSDIASGRATLILLHVKNGMLLGVFMGRVRIRERGAPTPAGRAARGRGRRARGHGASILSEFSRSPRRMADGMSPWNPCVVAKTNIRPPY